ncbi:hypothetical protein P175DRAFT_0433709 [Aspergillus ochraceoroseus IBT 24754]|uniref:PHD-type domain-containing protein n=3 Tax=Aspergillus subgen. Nidulantes TaxID=2720870 RepID=A0A0F8UMX3_9EURO|nr:uncharacterized protein P175DRAFT_0433709 [Aspergillus ochraceoroseus IBT 24754]KKK20969.1 hypothetical protein ARAM_000618 [Aspergillus rambellii]KKK24050.1 hypothetical protein AOCH_007689 [Aspergillus ochraceoroseus]PTU22799.1 hypothetical protein P175DRAFT_0433709 [Aspergillus ochraceoroseus IBT 24754]
MMLTVPSVLFSFSYPNGEPQTPTRTPPTTFFGDAAFQTPKLESSFFDPRVTWDTSDPYASSPEFLRTPQKFGLSTPRIPDDRSNQTVDDPETSVTQSAKALDQQTDTAKRRRPSRLHGLSEDGSRTVESTKSAASMQTPPPSSASRTKVTEFGGLAVAGRRPSASSVVGGHLETPSRLMGASPRLFGDLQSSPDPFQLGSIGPSASPFFPQQRLFWDHGLDHHARDMGLPGRPLDLFESAGTDAFHVHSTTAPQEPPIPQLPQIEGSLELPEFNSNIYRLSAAPTDAALFPAPFSTSPRRHIPKADDPALFLSSPARRFGGPQPTPEKRLFSRQHRQPYHHQTEEFRREELRRAQGISHHFPEYDDEDDADDYTPRQPRPGLTRSVTHTVLTSTSSRPGSSGMMSSASGVRKSPSKGRSSPIKPFRAQLPKSTSVASGLPRRSQSVVLRIGKDGRAKTEMQPVVESSTGLTDPVSQMDLDSSATESEYDSAEFSEYPTVTSRKSSYAFSDAGRSVIARSDSGSRPHSKGSYTSTATSHSGRVSPWATAPRVSTRRAPLNASMDEWRRTTPKRQSSILHADLSYTSAASISQSFADPEEDTGDAQHALRKVLQDKGRIPRSHSVAGYCSRSNRSLQSLAHLRSSPPRFGAELDLDAREANTSPTTVTDPDLATPSTDRYSNPSNGTRCICNSMDNGGHLMIQCESCSHWLHTKCVGLERSNLPSVYVCIFCAQTPTRKTRIRVPVSGVGHAPTSPLAHKSYRFR